MMRGSSLRVAVAALSVAILGFPATSLGQQATPSTAGVTAVGVPFGTYFPTPGQQWWRLPMVVRTGDQITVAADVTIEPYSLSPPYMGFCLTPVVDDFDASETVIGCVRDEERAPRVHTIEYGGKRRFVLTYAGQSGQGFMLIYLHDCCGFPTATYATTIEAIKPLIRIGFGQVARTISRSVAITANVQYGDASAVADGTSVTLSWKIAGGKYRTLRRSTTKAGRARLEGSLPRSTAGRRVLLRVCSGQTCLAAISRRVRGGKR